VARVAALYRYPVKGLTPEICEVLSIGADGRVLGVRFADTEAPDEERSVSSGLVRIEMVSA
jgi:MOSC domain-containing protein